MAISAPPPPRRGHGSSCDHARSRGPPNPPPVVDVDATLPPEPTFVLLTMTTPATVGSPAAAPSSSQTPARLWDALAPPLLLASQ
ncbi:UNVERIFIED_CONTAM: hypothetical protein Sradi_6152100 [Sesamum radiatum]|uniref:Uncharacterized protein n=1 Tax=Sesamum radiatum TaxID=300843 RepID=A0AAW2KLL7_SESRA